MASHDIFFPIFLQVCLTLVLLFALGRVRVACVRDGAVKMEDIVLGKVVWPMKPTLYSNAYNSQFQLPVLFYLVCLFGQIYGQIDPVMVILAWVFVISRIYHAGVHVATNNIRRRFIAFAIGLVVLMAMWIYLGSNLLQAWY